MHVSTLALTLAGATTALAKTAYDVPPMLAMKAAEQDSGCTLPREYTIKDFAGTTNNTKKATLKSLEFSFADKATQINTRCQFNSSSKSTSPEGAVKRYPCDNGHVNFIWVQERSSLWLIERVCPSTNGLPTYEASGSVDIPVSCRNASSCAGNATEYSGIYSSLQPIRDLQSFQNMWED